MFKRGNSKIFLSFLFAITFSLSCKTAYQPQSVAYADYRITKENKSDSTLAAMIRPYADSVNHSMNSVVAVTEISLEKKQPEGTLGNILADAMLAMARVNYKIPVDAGFINEGGIRLPSIPAGDITRGKIFELAPFDNVIVLQKLSGKILQQFLDHIAGNWGGWPCAGISWQVKNKKAINVLVGGKPLDENAIYTIANNDYVANGGDDCIMLKGIPQINNGYLFRDAVIAYFSQFTRAGKKLWVKLENRVSNAD